MQVRFSGKSRADLREIAKFIASDNPSRARSFVNELQDACLELSSNPERFAVLPRYQDKAYRRRPHGHYEIIHVVGEDTVTVLRVLHSAMKLATAMAQD